VTAAVRLVWASTRSKVLLGRAYRKRRAHPTRAQRLFGRIYEPGTHYELASVDLEQALLAFEQFLADPGTFKVTTAEGSSIDFAVEPKTGQVTLDLWLDAPFDDLDVAVVARGDAYELLERIYASSGDAEIAEWLRRVSPITQSRPHPQ
jgi:hypothetical protein